MRLSVFQANDGDCLLLTSEDGRNMLIDGGRKATFEDHTVPALGEMRDADEDLDVVYVSHIDNDHISGILRLMDLEVEWRTFDFQDSRPGANPREPRNARPPDMRALWHNSFRDMVEDNRGAIEEQLAFSMKVMGVNPELVRETEGLENLVTGIREGLRLSQRARPEVLGIPLNPEFDGRVMVAKRGAKPIALGSLAISILGPSASALEDLREDWNEWLEMNEDIVEDLRDEAVRTRERLGLDEGTVLRQAMIALSGELGKREDVTVPNLASLMLLVEEGKGNNTKRILLTGDGHTQDIVEGLKAAGKMDDTERLHVDVLKVPHHGAAANFEPEFARMVTADHYIFCGNGSHDNPEIDVLNEIIDSRLGGSRTRSPNPQAQDRFTFWFSSSEEAANTESRKEHMRKVEKLVLETRGGVEITASGRRRRRSRRGARARRAGGNRMRAFFMRDQSRVMLPEL